ncbi:MULTISPECIES: SRPBCC family protein [Ensifer]|jgi:carbon monoxide dehydrogenase subunit G|uniref:SRPBCC family protein n=1 Tax=Ensifer TaxID=106591 RepID=UPI0007132E58|nr:MULTISPECIES: carbon monoxide dehydrogenase subunit G [Ensifer]KQX43171.1 carbon monoxide dehydrogenase [Ensifer sp. Root1298]KQX72720.1 carbon monoxide dehydrogenase [Ensifer sp. Root1312]KRC15686.1 carbon monoxide dehydrogenase [Ensifer sp. Root74]KRD58961.1 carbon monoxide dehydrogenase [Ensifer sp. Root954]
MDMTGQQHIAATKEEVWSALNDAEVLRVCIPGCQELTKSSDTEMAAVAVIKVGPVKARFQGAVTLSDLDPPNGYKITGEGQGGVAGFAKGVANVRLESVVDGTVLHYTVDAQIGGKLSQLGGRLIDVTAKQMSGQFFKRFAQEIQARQGVRESTDRSDPVETKQKQQGTTPAANGSDVSAASAHRPASPAPAMGTAASPSLPILAAVVFAAVVVAIWAIFGGLLPSIAPAAEGRAHISPDLASVVQLIMAAAIGYLFGARSCIRG